MAQKRMFDKRVVESDIFTDLPNSSKALYFMAGMSADDKGFFQPRRLQKMCGFTDDDFKILIAKRFFIVFESGVMVITDWNKNNWLDSRRVNETEYVNELKLLKLVNEKYELVGGCLASAKPMLSQNSIEENSIEENSNIYIVEKPNEFATEKTELIDEKQAVRNRIITYLNERTGANYKFTTKKTNDLINARLKEGFTEQNFYDVIDKKTLEWKKTNYEKFLRPETLFSNKFESYLNQKVSITSETISRIKGIDMTKFNF